MKGATHYLPNPDGSVALYYRWEETNFSDGTKGRRLSYLSFAGLWMGTNERNPEEYARTKLLPLPETPA